MQGLVMSCMRWSAPIMSKMMAVRATLFSSIPSFPIYSNSLVPSSANALSAVFQSLRLSLDDSLTDGVLFVGRPRRMPKKANHGARPNSHVKRREKKPRHV
ncbi:hypothetical protein WA577_000043, partial [Blastocystis sp. JDR]